MSLAAVARFEIGRQLRRMATWLYFAIFLVLALAATASLVDDARAASLFFNGPLLIAAATVLTTLIGLLIMAGISGDAATRDVQTRMSALVYTTSIDRRSYVGGRFLGAFAVSALLLLAVPLGLIALLPMVEAQLIGPFRPLAYLGAYAFVALPNAFIVTAILFAVATFTRRAMSTLAAAAALFLLTLVSRELLAEVLGQWTLAKQLDPSAFTILSAMWRTWTPAQKNALLVPLTRELLVNRVVWMSIASALVAITHARFRFGVVGLGLRRSRFALAPLARLLALPLLAAALVIAGGELMEAGLGTPSIPATARVLPLFGNVMVTLAIGVLTTLYAGELVWKERDLRMDALVDVTPIRDRAAFFAKLRSLVLVLAAVQFTLLASGIVMQALQGYTHFELGLYLRVLFGLRFANVLLFGVLALTIHVLVNQKYLGHVIASLAFLYMNFAREIGIERKLFVYGSDPGWSYSDMNGFGASIGPWLWYKAFWFAWAVLLALIAKACWVRGRERRVRLTRESVVLAMGAVCAIVLTGGFIFINDAPDATAAAETHPRSAQPELTATKLQVELYPQRHAFAVRGTYHLVNRTTQPIATLHVVTNDAVETRINGRKADDHLYALGRPLQPGQSLDLQFDARYEPNAFRAASSPIRDNGTNFDPKPWLPLIGWSEERDEIRSLHDVAARRDTTERERIGLDVVIATDDDQHVVAPGTLRRTWTSNGRRYFHYATDGPIRNIYAFFSARYAVRKARWGNIPIEVWHHPEHAANVDRIIRSAQASLAYYTKHFGPYPHAQLRFVEFPRNTMLLRAYPGTIMYSEVFAMVNPADDARDLDLPFAVTAHEIAHQWWGHQIVPADVEGAPLLTESLAWYSAMMVVRDAYGEEHLTRLLEMMRREYLNPRAKAGVPLLRATDHFDVYRKGPFAMYALRDAVGEERINAALRALLARHGAARPPFPTSLDLYAQLRAVAPRNVVDDLFATNTFWEFENAAARAVPVGNAWRVTLDVRAQKTRVDVTGKERDVAMTDLVTIGVYAADGKPLSERKHALRSGAQTIVIDVPRRPAYTSVDPDGILIETKRDDNQRETVIGEPSGGAKG